MSAERLTEVALRVAERVIVAHQRRDIGSCLCGWGVSTGDLGRSHAAHVVEQLRAGGVHLLISPAALATEAGA